MAAQFFSGGDDNEIDHAFNNTAKSAGNAINKGANSAGKAINNTANSAGKAINNTAKSAGKDITNTANSAPSTITNNTNSAGSTITNTANSVGSAITNNLGATSGAAAGATLMGGALGTYFQNLPSYDESMVTAQFEGGEQGDDSTFMDEDGWSMFPGQDEDGWSMFNSNNELATYAGLSGTDAEVFTGALEGAEIGAEFT